MSLNKSNIHHNRVQLGGFAVHCQDCCIGRMCLPLSTSREKLEILDTIITRKKTIEKNVRFINFGEKCNYLYAIRSGSVKSYIIDEDGNEQINGFYISGDFIGFDGLTSGFHQTNMESLEPLVVCEITYDSFIQRFREHIDSQKMFLGLITGELNFHQQMLLAISQKTAEQRVATLIYSLSSRYEMRGFSPLEFKMSMSRSEMSCYLGLTIETISRFFTKLQTSGVIKVKGKHIVILDINKLKLLTGGYHLSPCQKLY